MNKLTHDLSPVEDYGFERHFEEPHFFEFFVQFLRNGELWVKAIHKGKKDKTIRNDLEDPIIVQYVTMLNKWNAIGDGIKRNGFKPNGSPKRLDN